MNNLRSAVRWESVVLPQTTIARKFTHEKTGREFYEFILPDVLPENAPRCGGWHFYMPAKTCVALGESSMRISFPPAWKVIHFLSPFVKGQQSEVIEYPISEALLLLREVFEQ